MGTTGKSVRYVLSAIFLSAAAAISPTHAASPKTASTQASIVIHNKDATGAMDMPSVVSANIILLIDASGSVDPVENAQMIEGVKETLLDTKTDYSGCFAMTVVRYALQSNVGNTHVFCSKAGARKFIDAELNYYPQVKPADLYNIGNGTMIGAGIASAMNVFQKREEGVLVERRAVFFIGDGPNGGGGSLRNDMETLARTYGATSYAVPIADRDEDEKENSTVATRQYYRANLVTPPGYTYVDKKVYGPGPVEVIPGLYSEAASFQDVGRAFSYVLQAARF